MRARIVVLAAGGVANGEIAARVGVSLPTVRLWLSRFRERGLDGLVDKPRSGRPRTVTDAHIKVVLATVRAPPDDGGHWSLQRLSAATGIPASTVHRILRANDLHPPAWSLPDGH